MTQHPTCLLLSRVLATLVCMYGLLAWQPLGSRRPMLVSLVAIIFIHPSRTLQYHGINRSDTYKVLEAMFVHKQKGYP